MRDDDTIVALSSGALPSGVAVVRLSGPGAGPVLMDVFGSLPPPRRLVLSDIALDGEVLDRGLVAWMPGPHSFTGEDCAELHLHGSPAVVRAVLRRLSARGGFRMAEAGEFTRRAFENGKLDLTAVEGIGDLLVAETESQRVQALARSAGGLALKIEAWRERLTGLRAEIEARLDFSDEGDVSPLPAEFDQAIGSLAAEFAQALADVGRGRIVREGLRVALAGPPNAGKSSLLNVLARSDVAIVTDEAGTTRDVREVPVDLGGRLLTFIDMAGLRETTSKAEAEGVRRAVGEISAADLVLWLVAPDVPEPALPPTTAPVWRVGTKADLMPSSEPLAVSTLSGAGLGELLARLTRFAADSVGEGLVLVSRERDAEALSAAHACLTAALQRIDAPELMAEDLRAASVSLERLVGRIDAEAVLGRLFSSFCIGK